VHTASETKQYTSLASNVNPTRNYGARNNQRNERAHSPPSQMQNVIHRSHRPSTSAQRQALSLPRGTEQSGEVAEEGRGSEGRV
jgi:hypothetical protein